MNGETWSPIIRIAWKDMRRIGALWVVLSGFWVVGILCAAAWQYADYSPAPTIDVVIPAILFTTIIYGLAWAAITFAAEHDDKTYGQLRSLPVSARQVFYGKLFFGVNSTLLLLATLGTLGGLHVLALRRLGVEITWTDVSNPSDFDGIPMFPTISLLLLIPLGMTIGMFWSLRIKRPLPALGLASVSIVILPYLGVVLSAFCAHAFHAQGQGAPVHLFLIAFLVCAATGIYLVDRRLVEHWLPNYSHGDVRPGQAPFLSARGPARHGTRLSRLFWMHRRQSFWFASGVAGIYLSFALLRLLGGDGVRNAAAYLLAPIGCGALGIMVFRHEQQESRFRWLAQLGARPIEYWTSRLLVPSIGAIVVAGSMPLIRPVSDQPSWGESETTVVASLLAVFTISQFCSIATSSVVLSVAATLFGTSIAMAWIALSAKLLITPWLACLPVVISPLAASYLRVSRWFRATGSWKQWVVPAAPLVLLVVGLPIATAFYRVAEIPGVELPPEMLVEPAPPTADERVGAAQLMALFAQLSPRMSPESLDSYLDEHPTWADELVKVLERPCVLPSEFEAVNAPWEKLSAAGDLLCVKGRRESAAGKIAKAWGFFYAALELATKCQSSRADTPSVLCGGAIEASVYRELVPWAMHEANTPELIDSAALDIDVRRQALPPWSDAVRNDRLTLHKKLGSDRRISDRFQENFLLRFLPWEVVRAERLIDFRLAHDFNRVRSLHHGGSDRGEQLLAQGESEQIAFDRYQRTTLFDADLDRARNYSFFAQERARCGTIYQLAAVAYHRRHGKYPNDATKLALAGRPLLDDADASQKLVILGLEGDDDLGPRLGSSRVTTADKYFHDASWRAHFLLPVFEGWEPEQFQKRIARSTRDASALGERQDMGTEGEDTLMQGSPELNPYDALDLLPAEIVAKARDWAVRSLLSDGPADQQAHLLNVFRDRPQLAHRFLPEVAQLSDSTDVRLAARAAILLLRALQTNLAETCEVVEDCRERLSTGTSARDLGTPVRNPENGHFYEVILLPKDGKGPELYAGSRTFRGVRGHLATVTSQGESEFVVALVTASIESGLSSGAILLGGSDRDEKGVWRWTSGPETGQVFWSGSDDASGEFTNWLEGEPTSSGFLLLETSLKGGMFGWMEAGDSMDAPGMGGYGMGGYGMGEYGGAMGGGHGEMGGAYDAEVETEVQSGWRSQDGELFAGEQALIEYEMDEKESELDEKEATAPAEGPAQSNNEPQI